MGRFRFAFLRGMIYSSCGLGKQRHDIIRSTAAIIAAANWGFEMLLNQITPGVLPGLTPAQVDRIARDQRLGPKRRASSGKASDGLV